MFDIYIEADIDDDCIYIYRQTYYRKKGIFQTPPYSWLSSEHWTHQLLCLQQTSTLLPLSLPLSLLPPPPLPFLSRPPRGRVPSQVKTAECHFSIDFAQSYLQLTTPRKPGTLPGRPLSFRRAGPWRNGKFGTERSSRDWVEVWNQISMRQHTAAVSSQYVDLQRGGGGEEELMLQQVSEISS